MSCIFAWKRILPLNLNHPPIAASTWQYHHLILTVVDVEDNLGRLKKILLTPAKDDDREDTAKLFFI